MPRPRLWSNRKGQFIVLTSIGIVLAMVAVSYLLAYTAVSPIQFSKTDYRVDVTNLDLNFRKALATALADVTKELEYRASRSNYMSFASLAEYPLAAKEGQQFVTEWQKVALTSYAVQTVSLKLTQPDFRCDWSTDTGYSAVTASMSLNITSNGFYGWKSKTSAALNATILGLKETDGNKTSFYVTFKQELGNPVEGLTLSQMKVLFRQPGGTFLSTHITQTAYYGQGSYMVTYYANTPTILDNLNTLKERIDKTPQSLFLSGYSPQQLNLYVDSVINYVHSGELTNAYSQLLHGVRPRLEIDPPAEFTWLDLQKVNTNGAAEDISLTLGLIDYILAQLNPSVKLFMSDPRGLIVGAYAVNGMLKLGPDTVGPEVETIFLNPNPVVQGFDLANLTATIDDFQSNILNAEYFVNSIGPNGSGTPLTPKDGAFDSPIEDVNARINTTDWTIGNYTVYVHGIDSAGNWGPYTSLLLRRTVLTPVELRPNGAGQLQDTNLKQYPPLPYANVLNYQYVYEAVADDNKTYVYTDSIYAYYTYDLYELQDSSINYGNIQNVTVNIRCKSTTGKGGAETLIRPPGTSPIYSNNFPLTSTYTNYQTTYTTNPYTGKTWTWQDINNLQIGVALSTGGSGIATCTQVWIVVYWGK